MTISDCSARSVMLVVSLSRARWSQPSGTPTTRPASSAPSAGEYPSVVMATNSGKSSNLWKFGFLNQTCVKFRRYETGRSVRVTKIVSTSPLHHIVMLLHHIVASSPKHLSRTAEAAMVKNSALHFSLLNDRIKLQQCTMALGDIIQLVDSIC